jgi:thioredoxin
MMNKNLIVIALALVFALTNCGAGNPGESSNIKDNSLKETKGKPINLTNESFKKLVFNYDINKQWKYEGNKPAIVDFYANWCGPCRMIAPILDELAKEYEDQIIIYKVDTDKETVLSQTLGVRSLPTLVFVPVNGQPQAIMGAQPKENLVKAINEILLTK